MISSNRFVSEYDVWDPENQNPEKVELNSGFDSEGEEMSEAIEKRLEHLGYK